MAYADSLPSKSQIFSYWKDRFWEIGILVDWSEPSCWSCGFHYGIKYDIKKPSSASWDKILNAWDRIPLQRCHIVPRSLGGADEPSNLFLMCRECHDLQPNTALPDIFFKWVRAQTWGRRESSKIEEALRSFDVRPEQHEELTQLVESPDFKTWLDGKLGLHRPQSNYASVSCRLTPATMIGLAVHYLKSKRGYQNCVETREK
jgi:hypothetical protein